MAEMSPGRDMQKFMKSRKKVGKDPELQLKGGISSKRSLVSNESSQEKRAARMAKMMKRGC